MPVLAPALVPVLMPVLAPALAPVPLPVLLPALPAAPPLLDGAQEEGPHLGVPQPTSAVRVDGLREVLRLPGAGVEAEAHERGLEPLEVGVPGAVRVALAEGAIDVPAREAARGGGRAQPPRELRQLLPPGTGVPRAEPQYLPVRDAAVHVLRGAARRPDALQQRARLLLPERDAAGAQSAEQLRRAQHAAAEAVAREEAVPQRGQPEPPVRGRRPHAEADLARRCVRGARARAAPEPRLEEVEQRVGVGGRGRRGVRPGVEGPREARGLRWREGEAGVLQRVAEVLR